MQFILQIFRDLNKTINRKEQQITWQKLQDFIQTQTTPRLGLSEFLIWSQAKLEHTRMETIVQREVIKNK